MCACEGGASAGGASSRGAALSDKWLCSGKPTPATAIKVVVAGSSLSKRPHVKR